VASFAGHRLLATNRKCHNIIWLKAVLYQSQDKADPAQFAVKFRCTSEGRLLINTDPACSIALSIFQPLRGASFFIPTLEMRKMRHKMI
jgi:hypothetical protein